MLLFVDCGTHPPDNGDRKKRAVSIANNNGNGCDSGEICCGGGPENCICPSPKIKDKKGLCRGIYILFDSVHDISFTLIRRLWKHLPGTTSGVMVGLTIRKTCP